ncbi:hypothetical protein DY000_02004741 [Brassica cretica]|uniref:Reverse transcriptase Ty1/copia-type domain-containing protein n=1 Tax=Brassica cretica TaxID=69181 RepID=A0ABQ7CKB4_BRACR|nr:hypothetical protein DY000_02004741 [Brassica cretica]
MTCLDDLLVSRPDDLWIMRQLHAVYGEWLLQDCCWDFVVDNVKGARMFFLSEGSTHDELLAMAQEDYILDMSTKSVEITYSLPTEMMLAPYTPPIHVTKFREEDDEANECFEDDDDDLVEDENHDGEEDDGEEEDGEEDDGEEDADISIVAEADENGEDYSVYGKHITDAMKNMFGMKLDYTTLYRALFYAQTLVRGSTEDGYSCLPSYLEQISLANPDSITAIELDSINRLVV